MEETGFGYVCRIGNSRAACVLRGIIKSADPLALEGFRGQNRLLPSNQPASVYRPFFCPLLILSFVNLAKLSFVNLASLNFANLKNLIQRPRANASVTAAGCVVIRMAVQRVAADHK